MKNKIILGTILGLSIFLLSLIGCFYSLNDAIPSENINAVLSILEDDVSGIAWPNQSTVNLNSLSASNTQGIEFTPSGVVINTGGNYIFSGTLENGSITVNTNETVNLTFNKASITNLSGPALYIKDAAQTYITLISNTKNFLVDGENYSNTDATGTLYSNSSLTVQGGGSLDITSISHNGISSHAPITINSGSIKVTAAQDGIYTSNSAQLSGGHLSLDIKALGINCEGSLTVNDGVIDVISATTGLQSDRTLTINGGSLNISNVGSGIKSQANLIINDGNINVLSEQNSLLATTTLTVNDGNIHLDSKGDALVASERITLNNGLIIASSGGPSAYTTSGNSNAPTINGGTILVTSNKITLPNEDTSKQLSLLLGGGLADSMVHISQNTLNVLTFMPANDYNYLLFSSPVLNTTSEYTLYSGGTAQAGTNFYGLYSDSIYTGGEKITYFSLVDPLTNLSDSPSLAKPNSSEHNPPRNPEQNIYHAISQAPNNEVPIIQKTRVSHLLINKIRHHPR